MRRFIDFIRNEVWQSTGFTALKIWVMMTAVLLHLLNADFSTAPAYIYSQF